MKRTLLAIALASASSFAFADEITQYRDETRAIVGPFVKTLIEANKKAVMEGGPEAAIKVCKEVAPSMAGEVSRKNGIRLTRVSLKVRNPLLGTPDVWEQGQLKKFEDRLLKGEAPDTLEATEIVSEPAGKSFRYMKAIVLQPGCVACHGKPEEMSDSVKAQLGEGYPKDKATGYAAGQLRGAVSVKRPL